MTEPEDEKFWLTGACARHVISERYKTLLAARHRLEDLCACVNEIAEGDPAVRARGGDRYVLTGAPHPELIDGWTGGTLVTIEEMSPACARPIHLRDPTPSKKQEKKTAMPARVKAIYTSHRLPAPLRFLSPLGWQVLLTITAAVAVAVGWAIGAAL